MTYIQSVEFAISKLNTLAEKETNTFEYNKLLFAVEKLEDIRKMLVDIPSESV
jgi:hypothetical protein